MRKILANTLPALLVLAMIFFSLHHASMAYAALYPLTGSASSEDSTRSIASALQLMIGRFNIMEIDSQQKLTSVVESARVQEVRESVEDLVNTASVAYLRLDRNELKPEQCLIIQQCSLRDLMQLMIERKLMIDRLPTALPCNGRITSTFGNRIHPIAGMEKHHNGLDLAAPSGSPILAAGAGTVVFAGVRSGYGNVVEIDHGYGYRSLYAHASKLLVNVGDAIARGQEIARVGSTGASTGAHLHFEITVDETNVDPAPFIDALATPMLLASR